MSNLKNSIPSFKQSQEILLEQKNCKKENYKYCNNGSQLGNCIRTNLYCVEYNDNPDLVFQSEFSKTIEILNNRRTTLDNFNYSDVDTSNIRYKLPYQEQIFDDYYLVKIDIQKLKTVMPETNSDDLSHNKIYSTNNLELLSWLLAGLHGQEIVNDHVNTSFIKYYFDSYTSYIKTPIVQLNKNAESYNFNIVDGRHRLGFYNYFNINGFILTNKIGRDFLIETGIAINFIELEYNEQCFFSENMFFEIENIQERYRVRSAPMVVNRDRQIERICPKCKQIKDHPFWKCPK